MARSNPGHPQEVQVVLARSLNCEPCALGTNPVSTAPRSQTHSNAHGDCFSKDAHACGSRLNDAAFGRQPNPTDPRVGGSMTLLELLVMHELGSTGS